MEKVFCEECKFFHELNYFTALCEGEFCLHPNSAIANYRSPEGERILPEIKNKLNNCSDFEPKKKHKK